MPAANPDSRPMLMEVAFRLTQTGDGFDDPPGSCGCQELTVHIGSEGAGPYMAVKTERWSFDQVDEFANLLRDIRDAVFPVFTKVNGES